MAVTPTRAGKPTRDQMLGYINGVHVQGLTKKDSYISYVNPRIKNVHQAITAMEKIPEFTALKDRVLNDDDCNIEKKVQKVRLSYVNLVSKNIDTAINILDEVKNADLKDKAVAVRLVNETVSAMAIIDGGRAEPGNRPQLNRGGVIS